MDVDRSYVSRILREAGVKAYKRIRSPEFSPELKQRQKTACRKLIRNFCPPSSPIELVMDDGSYFRFQGDEMSGSSFFYTQDKENTPPSVKFKPKKKFPKKLLMWITISERGHSEPFFLPKHGNINGETYREHCIINRLVPFLDEHYPEGNYLFWPDLASSHYAKDTIQLFEDRSIEFVPRELNPPAVPKLRPIEDFWGVLKQAVYQGGWDWEAKSEDMLKRRIRKCLREFDWDVIRRMMMKAKTNLRKAADTSLVLQ